MQLLKVHGSQNHFFILDQTLLSNPLNDNELKNFTQAITNPKTGLLGGADGVLVVNKATKTGALAQMRVINADGSEASMCGNGLRTVSRYMNEKTGQKSFKVQTMNANLRVRKETDLATGVPAFAVEISPVRFNQSAFPFYQLGHERIMNDFLPEVYPGLRFTAIAVPNPHLMAFVNRKQIEGPILGEVGQYLNGENPYFPDGVNVNFVQIIDRNQIFVRTYERGVGFTNACGTGMSASSLALCLIHPEKGQLDQTMTIYNPGGLVKTIVHRDQRRYRIELIGNATFTHKIEIDEKDLRAHNFDKVKIKETHEQSAYEKFVHDVPHFNNVGALA